MTADAEVGNWRRCHSHGCRGVLAKNLKRCHLKCTTDGLTSREDKLELDQFHVREIGVDWLVEDPHPYVLHLG